MEKGRPKTKKGGRWGSKGAFRNWVDDAEEERFAQKGRRIALAGSGKQRVEKRRVKNSGGWV